MREFKFRAWDNGTKSWLMGYEMPSLGGFSMFGECMLFEEWSKVLNTYLLEKEGHKRSDLILMQSTGCKDKNLNLIYEGDVIKHIRGEAFSVEYDGTKYHIIPTSNITETRAEIKRSRDEARDDWDTLWDPHYGEYWEVIGNIYENPELLK